MGITIAKSRTARLQCHQANAGAADQSSSDYYRINVYYPFIDHVVKELETRFSSDHEGLIAVHYLVPVHLPQLSQDHIDSLEYYHKRRKSCGTNVVRFNSNHTPYSHCANFNCAIDPLL